MTSTRTTIEPYYLVGPLTTIFTPQPWCLDTLSIEILSSNLEQTVKTSGGSGSTHFGTAYTIAPFPNNGCFPQGYFSTSTSYVYYSPGRCPAGYTVATEYAITKEGSGVRTYKSVIETVQTCCPTSVVPTHLAVALCIYTS